MTDSIGRGDYVLGLDKTEVTKGVADAESEIKQSGDRAEKTYADSGAKAGKAFSSGLATGLKIVGVAATAAFSFATKGLIELDDVTANYRRETGATATEAAKAGDAINKMAGKNIQPMHEIGSALAAVHTQMGLTDTAAESMTAQFLKFGRATGQEATQAVKSFDDILDAWGLTAKDATRIMDLLIASHQKYGGSIEANQEALRAMAPQLKALNLSIDDGVGLLNLFASSGLDASSAQRALNTAISKLPSGTTLQDFIAHLATITDDGQRAQEAMTVFGTRAGAGLANAIKPGVASLDAFKLKTDQYTGATERAADAANSTFGSQIQLAIKGFGSAMNAAFKDAGPLLTGLGALSSVGATLGVDTLLKKLAPRVIDGMKAIGTKAGDALGDGLSAVWSGAGGTIIGNNIASRIENIMDPTRSTVIGNAWRGAASKAATVYLSALVFQDTVIAAIGAKFGTTLGTAAGTSAGIAFRLGFVAGVILIADQALPIAKDLGKKINEAIFGPSKGPAFLDTLDWPLGNKNPPDWAVQAGLAKKQAAQIGTATLDGIAGAIRSAAGTVGDALAEHQAELREAAKVYGKAFELPIADAAKTAIRAVRSTLNSIVTAIATARTEIDQIAQGVADAIWDPQLKAAAIAQTKLDLAEQHRIINDKKSTKAQVREAEVRTLELQKQLFVQVTDISTYGTDAQQIARIKAALASKAVATAYRTGTKEQRAAIDQWRIAMNEKLTELQGNAGTGGEKTTTSFAAGVRAKKAVGNVGSAVGAVVDKVDPLKGLSGSASTWGGNVTESFAKGLSGAIQWVINAAKDVAAAVWKYLHHSIPDPASPLADLVPSARRAVSAYADALAAGRPKIRAALQGVALGMGSLGDPTFALASGRQPSAAGPTTNNHVTNQTVNVQGLLRAETPEDVALQMRRAASLGF